jgi:hypothetical protein
MTSIFDTVTNLFSGKNELEEFKKNKATLQQFIKATDNKFTNIIKEMINSYLNNKKLLAFQLLDSVVCKDTSIYLSDTLQKQLTSIDLKGTEILYEKKKYSCDDYNSCEKLIKDIKFKTKKGEITNKKEICDTIATFNIRIMNLVAALLVQLDPKNNIAIQRMNVLYNSINDEELQISLCNQKQQKLLDEYGLNELINLYLYNILLSDNDNVASLVEEYNNLVNILEANLANKQDTVMVDDIKLATTLIKDSLKDFHNKFRVKQEKIYNNMKNNNAKPNNAKPNNITPNNTTPNNTTPNNTTPNNTTPNNTTPNNTNNTTPNNTNNNMKPENQAEIERDIKLEEQNGKLTAQQQTINTQTIKLEEQTVKISSQESMIEEQKRNIEELKGEMDKLKEQLKKHNEKQDGDLKEMEDKLKEVNTKYETLKAEKKQENNNEVQEVKREILALMNKVKSKRKTIQKGGDLEDVAERFKGFMEKFNVSSSTGELQNRFFTLFDKELKIPDKIKNICSNDAKLDDSKMITIKLIDEDTDINNYLRIYNDMTNYYINRIKDMVRILEDELLEVKYNSKKEVVSVKIRNLTEEQLREKESRIRKLLGEYINQIHTYYLSAISELNIYLSRI